jgi:hypothetical protein
MKTWYSKHVQDTKNWIKTLILKIVHLFVYIKYKDVTIFLFNTFQYSLVSKILAL